MAQNCVLYENNFEKEQIGKVPENFLVLDGGFAVKEEAGNKFLELPGSPSTAIPSNSALPNLQTSSSPPESTARQKAAVSLPSASASTASLVIAFNSLPQKNCSNSTKATLQKPTPHSIGTPATGSTSGCKSAPQIQANGKSKAKFGVPIIPNLQTGWLRSMRRRVPFPAALRSLAAPSPERRFSLMICESSESPK